METSQQITFQNLVTFLEEEGFTPSDKSIELMSFHKSVFLKEFDKWIQNLRDQSDYFEDSQDDIEELEELVLRYQRGVCNHNDYDQLLFHLYQISL